MNYALVTGGSRGIGRAICLRLAQIGYHVLINYATNHEAALHTLSLVQEAGGNGEIIQFDVADAQASRHAIDTWQQAHEGEYISVLVNNAGIRQDNLMALMPQEEWLQVLNTSLNGFFNVTQPLLIPMQYHKHGRIINIASLSGIIGLPGQTNYSAAKGGLISATKALAKEVARKNITCNAIAPGYIKTDMLEGLDEATLKKSIPANRLGTPEEVAECVAFLCSPLAGYVTGNVISINGGM